MEGGESWEMHYETRETRCTAIFMCTLTKVSFLRSVRGAENGVAEKGQSDVDVSILWKHYG